MRGTRVGYGGSAAVTTTIGFDMDKTPSDGGPPFARIMVADLANHDRSGLPLITSAFDFTSATVVGSDGTYAINTTTRLPSARLWTTQLAPSLTARSISSCLDNIDRAVALAARTE